MTFEEKKNLSSNLLNKLPFSEKGSQFSLDQIFAWMTQDYFMDEYFYSGEQYVPRANEFSIDLINLAEIEKFVLEVVSSEELGYELDEDDTDLNGKKKTKISKTILTKYAKLLFIDWGDKFGRFGLSPYVKNFFRVYIELKINRLGLGPYIQGMSIDPCKKYKVHQLPPAQQSTKSNAEPDANYSSAKPFYEIFNEFTKHIRQKIKSEVVRNIIKHRKADIKNKVNTYQKYIHSLFFAVPQLKILRLDLTYGSFPHESVSLAKKKEDLSRLLNNLRMNSIFDGLVGYIWQYQKKQFGPSYWHVMLLFDTSDNRQMGINLANEVGHFWESTLGEGRVKSKNLKNDQQSDVGPFFFDCSLSLIPLKNLCTGLMYRDDVDSWRELNDLVEYMVTKDYYLILPTTNKEGAFLPSRAHTIGRGRNIPPKKKCGMRNEMEVSLKS